MHPDSRLIVDAPEGKFVITIDQQPTPKRITEWLRQANLPLNTRCGQRGLCDGCLVELVCGALIEAGSGQALLASTQPMTVQGCQCCAMPGSTATIRVPARSLLAHHPQVVTSFRVDVSWAHDPLWQLFTVPGEQLAGAEDPVEQVCRIAGRRRGNQPPETATASPGRDANLPVEAGPGLAEFLAVARPGYPLVLEQQGERWTVLPGPAETERDGYGLAIDIGTTTVAAVLIDLSTGQVRNTASALNGQVRLGDNVLTRINVCMQKPELVKRLQHAIGAKTVRPLLAELLTESSVAVEQVKCLVVAGNTTMLHLLAGVDPSPLGTAPFTPVFLEHRVLNGRELALIPKSAHSPHRARHAPAVHLLPGAAAYVGSDVIAGVFSTGMAYREHPCLLVDVGTNGEIILKHSDRLLGCATAAGPAFEGAGLTSGMRAGQGAVSHIRLDPQTAEPEIEVIGSPPPIGICGTAYVDFLAEARECGLIGPSGRFSEAFASHPRMVKRQHSRGFAIAKLADGKSIQITEADIASLLQAKAAIAAGIVCLLRRAGLVPEDLATLYLAGGFGFHMNVSSVLRCGMLPGFSPQQIELVGNSSLAGAFLALMDAGVLAEMKHIAEHLETVELNLEPDFESVYIDQLILP
jgi:uncharacterized 2Fe-2S/4Fe-4S cluster protein (DUF4445 family)/ferredoxin